MRSTATCSAYPEAERLVLGEERIAFVRVGSARLELIERVDSAGSARGSGTAGSATRGASVVDHVAFEVTDLDAALESLRSHGVPLLDPQPMAVDALGARIAFCLGPDAERIELFEPPRSAASPNPNPQPLAPQERVILFGYFRKIGDIG